MSGLRSRIDPEIYLANNGSSSKNVNITPVSNVLYNSKNIGLLSSGVFSISPNSPNIQIPSYKNESTYINASLNNLNEIASEDSLPKSLEINTNLSKDIIPDNTSRVCVNSFKIPLTGIPQIRIYDNELLKTIEEETEGFYILFIVDSLGNPKLCKVI